MRGVVMYSAATSGSRNARTRIIEPTDAIVRLTATCICGSDLWPYRGVEPADHQVWDTRRRHGRGGRRGGQERESRRLRRRVLRDLGQHVRDLPARASSPMRTRGVRLPDRYPGRVGPYSSGRWHAGRDAPARPELIPSLLATSDVLGRVGSPRSPQRLAWQDRSRSSATALSG